MTTPYTEEDVEAVARAIYQKRLGGPITDNIWARIKIMAPDAGVYARAALDTLIQRGWRKGE